METSGSPRSNADRDRYYVQKDKHHVFQKWGKDEVTSAFPSLKDAFVFAVSVGWANRRRVKFEGGRQHVGFWKAFDSQNDIPLIQAIGIAETGDPSIVADTGRLLGIAEEYANGGIDILETYQRADRDGTIHSIAALIVESANASGKHGQTAGRP